MKTASIKKTAILVVFAGLSFGGWLATRGDATIDAIGGTWSAPDAQWHDIDGAFRGRFTFHAVRVELQSANSIELVESLCRATLDQIDRVAPEVVQPENVYRLDINVKGANAELLFPRHLPVAVRAGVCQPAITDDVYYPIYPAPLEAWFLAQTGLMNAGDDGVIPIFRFQNMPGARPSPETFDFEFACQALLEDQTASDAINSTPPRDGKLRIVARSGSSLGSIAAVGVYEEQDMIVEDGSCRRVGDI